MSTELIFGIMFVVFSAVILYAGVYTKKWVAETSDYILAGREVSLLINIMGVAAIGFAGTTISLAPGFALMFGVWGSIAWGVIYAAFGLIFYGVVFSKFIRRSGAQTLPEYLEMRYGSKVRSIVAIGTIVGLCGILANNIVSCVGVVSGFIGWDPVYVTAAVFGIIIVFTTMSGLWAATVTDFFQVVTGTVAVPLFLFLTMSKFGGWDFVASAWPTGDVMTNGISGLSLSIGSIKYPSALTFVLLFSTALVLGNNYYWIKIASCRSEKVGRNSFVLAGLFLIVVFFVPLTLIGAYAGAVMPDAFTLVGGKIPPTAVYGAFAKLFPPVLSSLFIVGAVAASISTASTATIGATSTATRDIYQRLIAPGADAKRSLKASKIIMILVGVMTWILTFFPGGPTYLFAFANAWLVPPAVLLIFGMIWPRFNETGALGGVIAGIVTMAVLTLTDLLKIFTVSKWTHLAIVGLGVTVVFGVIFTYFGKPKYYGDKNWSVKATVMNREEIVTGREEIEVLRLIAVGHGYMSDITDALGIDSKGSSAIIANLDRGGYIEREGLIASRFYRFHLTDKGRQAAEAHMSDEEKRLAAIGLTPQYVGMMQMIDKTPADFNNYIKQQGWKSLKVSSATTHLTRSGYIVERGLYKRRLEMTDKGRQALQSAAASK